MHPNIDPQQPKPVVQSAQAFPQNSEPMQTPPPQFQTPDRVAWQPYFPHQIDQSVIPTKTGTSWITQLFILALIATATVLGFAYRAEAAEYLALIGCLGSSDGEKQLKGFLVVGFIGVVLVVIVKLLVSGNRPRNN